MDLPILLAILAVIAITHLLGSIAAFGSSMLTLPILIWFMDVKDARTILLLAGIFQSYIVFACIYRDIDWKLLGRMMFFAALGLPIGIGALHHLPEKPLVGFLGILLIISGASRLQRGSARHPRRWPRPVLDGLLVLGGIIHGAFVCGGPALVVYAQHMSPEKDAFRGTLTAFWTLVNTILLVALFFGDTRIPQTMPVLVAGIPLVIVASLLGNRMARRMSQEFFSQIVAVLLILSGIVSIARIAGKM